MDIAVLYKIYQQYPAIVTDTRKILKNCIFFCLKGPNFNGNLFAQQALDLGAAYVVADEKTVESDNVILVDDVLQTLQKLALHHRQQFNIPFIAITGSNGKTTTKELVYAVLATHYKTYTTQGNLNNHIGIPLTLLSVRPDAEMAVIEMGANHLKEIEGYCIYTKPTHGIITNCGKAHLEGFGGIEGVKKGKGELFDYLKNNEGAAFAFDDYDYLHEMTNGLKEIIWYGSKNGIVAGTARNRHSFLQVNVSSGLGINKIDTKLVGDYNLPNVLCALAMGKYFKVPEEKIIQAIESYAPSNSRSQLMQWKGNDVILDAYNANPSSIKLAIENFANIDAERKIILLGAMMEMGEGSIDEHKQIVGLLQKYNWQDVVLVGGDFAKVKHPYHYYATSAEAGNWLKQEAFKDATILIKGSRSIQMEKALL